MPSQYTLSSFTWGGIFDTCRRQYAGSASFTEPDRLLIIRKVSSFAYRYMPWPFTLQQTTQGTIQAVNLQQDYPGPADLYRITRAWFYIPTQNTALDSTGDGTIPPVDDPSAMALQAATLSANYVGSENGGGTPAGTTWPRDGSFNLVKRLPPNLYPYAYTAIRSICQQPNNGLVRLNAATAVSSSQPYSLEMEYQPQRPTVNNLVEPLWFPDDYLQIGMEGLIYELYRATNDARAGVASYGADGSVAYSGQYAVWMGAMESAAAAERAGSVNTIVPSSSLGGDDYQGGLAYGWV